MLVHRAYCGVKDYAEIQVGLALGYPIKGLPLAWPENARPQPVGEEELPDRSIYSRAHRI
jgi:hypothetical protein